MLERLINDKYFLCSHGEGHSSTADRKVLSCTKPQNEISKLFFFASLSSIARNDLEGVPKVRLTSQGDSEWSFDMCKSGLIQFSLSHYPILFIASLYTQCIFQQNKTRTHELIVENNVDGNWPTSIGSFLSVVAQQQRIDKWLKIIIMWIEIKTRRGQQQRVVNHHGKIKCLPRPENWSHRVDWFNIIQHILCVMKSMRSQKKTSSKIERSSSNPRVNRNETAVLLESASHLTTNLKLFVFLALAFFLRAMNNPIDILSRPFFSSLGKMRVKKKWKMTVEKVS